MEVNAKFVSSWDHGSSKFKSNCKFNTVTKEVTDIETINVDDSQLNYLDEEYVELENGDEIKTFNFDGISVVDGQRDE